MRITNRAWPVLIISAQFDAKNDEGFRLKALVDKLKDLHALSVYPSFSYDDGAEIFMSRADLAAVIIDWDMPVDKLMFNGDRSNDRHFSTIRLC